MKRIILITILFTVLSIVFFYYSEIPLLLMFGGICTTLMILNIGLEVYGYKTSVKYLKTHFNIYHTEWNINQSRDMFYLSKDEGVVWVDKQIPKDMDFRNEYLKARNEGVRYYYVLCDYEKYMLNMISKYNKQLIIRYFFDNLNLLKP